MALKPDPSEQRRLIGDNTSEVVTLSIADATNFPLGGWMLGGDDLVTGSTANDLIFGNEGEDIISGELGNDSLFGGKNKDLLSGDQGNDSLSGGQDADFLRGGAGNDILLGGRGNDFLLSGNGNDTLVGGLGRDVLAPLEDNGSIKIGGSTLYVLQAEPGVTDVNNADAIVGFTLGVDRIGLANGLTANDIVLENLTNALVTLQFDFSQAISFIVPPDILAPKSAVTSGTLIKVKNSGDLIGFVESVTPAQLQNSIISVQGF
jgi:Ca2+-binding RTX toxin-like protein